MRPNATEFYDLLFQLLRLFRNWYNLTYQKKVVTLYV